MKFSIYLIKDGSTEQKTKELLQSKNVEDVIVGDGSGASLLEAIKKAKEDFLLVIDDNIAIDEEIFEEFEELFSEGYDFLYPNFIINNRVKNFHDWSEQKIELVQGFELENEIPSIGYCIRKEKFLGLDPAMGKYAMYDFLYKNIKKINLKLAELSFLETTAELPKNSDYSYNSKTLRDIINIYDWQKELFYHLNWKKEEIAQATALTLIGNRLSQYNDYFNAAQFYQKAALVFHNQESIKSLIVAYYNMGEFEEARKIAKTQLEKGQEQEDILFKIEKTEELIERLEALAVEQQLKPQDFVQILDVYNGASIHNILGAVYLQQQEPLKAFEQFYLAATKNPISQVILENLAGCSKIVNKEEEVKGLYRRLLPQADGL